MEYEKQGLNRFAEEKSYSQNEKNESCNDDDLDDLDFYSDL